MPVPLSLAPGRATVVREPLGVVLVIAPWNYPVQLCLAPLVGALAAGNAVVLKPSEVAPATSAVLARLLPQHLDAAAVHVVEGGVPETTALLAERFDHIFYTGNGAVGRIVLEAAARHLTPVTLELGGKSPAFVADDADLEVTARRLVWGKFTNAGQTCVAPDYVLASRSTLEALKPLLGASDPRSVRRRPGGVGRLRPHRQRRATSTASPRSSTRPGRHRRSVRRGPRATSRPPSSRSSTRTTRASSSCGRRSSARSCPLVAVDDLDAAIDVVNRRDKPLALYVFTTSDEVRQRFVRDTSSGALGFNIPLAHLAVPGLPFGGVGPSGMGAYHGERSVELFSHAKAVLSLPTRPDTTVWVRPPFTALKQQVIARLAVPGRRRRRDHRSRRRSE